MISGLVLFLLDRWYKSVLSSQLTRVVLVNPPITIVVTIGVLVFWVAAYRRLIPLTGVGWVTFGVLSNLFDVVTQRGVVDYLPLAGFMTNIADVLIVGGCLQIGLHLIRQTSGRP